MNLRDAVHRVGYLTAMRAGFLVPAFLAFLAAPALAQEREFCANRPGIGTPACTLAPGSAMVETGVAEWEHSSNARGTDDSATYGDFLVRAGVSESAEIQIGFTSFIRDRSRDRASRQITRTSDVGDAFMAVRRGLAGPNGPVAIEAYVSAPADHLGRWSAGLLLPTDVDLPSGFQLALTPELDLTAGDAGHGRHVVYGGVIGLSHGLGANLSVAGELAAFEDAVPAGHALDARFAGSLAWQVTPRLQLDVEADAGLAAGAPDRAVMIGFADRFR